MPAYLIRHKGGQRDDALIEDPHLSLSFSGDWAIFSDADGPCLALTTDQATSIQRIDPDDETNDRPAPEG